MNLRRLLARVALTLSFAVAAVAPSLAQNAEPAAPAQPQIQAVAAPGLGAAKAAAATDNPYGLEALWKTSDAVAKAVLLMLVAMSMGSWYVIITKLFEQSRMNRQARAVERVWEAPTIAHGAEQLERGSPFRYIAEIGVEATRKHGGLLAHVDLNEWLTLSLHRATERVQSRMQNGLALLATVGSVSPFVGLFGTVWGIYHALTAIGVAGQASIDKVAGPVGEALIMTAIGLAVAVPAVLGYNWLVRRNKGVMDEVRAFGNELHPAILASVKAA
ncbi:MotA/TolQ/ExbB proton channel family protein [Caldimonas sp. KR1-144]|uniref:MotA/TolQ/ExbB proton channel family protein n=1 Tax=Caldimonas sp. KR1-144 TaxID=3400911 RepID=UPI003C02ED92